MPASAGLFDFCQAEGCLQGWCTYPQKDGTRNVKNVVDCWGGMCGTCSVESAESNDWADPKLEVIFVPGMYTWANIPEWTITNDTVYKSILHLSECKFMAGLPRFCARIAQPGTNGNDLDTTNPERPIGKPRLCAYEDPWDSTEGGTHDYEPHHHRETEKGILYNLTVLTNDVGCEDMHLGPLPPTWTHSAWLDASAPMPDIILDPESVFEGPIIELKRCQDPITHRPVSCSIVNAEVIQPPLYLTPNSSNDYKHCVSITTGETILNPSISNVDYKDRAFCAVVSKDSPEYVTINMLSQDLWTPGLKRFDRPGYMPKPTVVEADNSDYLSPKLLLTLRGKSLLLEDNPLLYKDPPQYSASWDPARARGYLHQVEFRLKRPCEAGKMVTENVVVAGVTHQETKCTQYKNVICVEGYTTAPLTVVKKASNPPTTNDDVPIGHAPNVVKEKNIAFANTNAVKEFNRFLQETFTKDVTVLNPDLPETCYRRNEDPNNPYCQNDSGACVSGDAGTVGNCNNYAIEHNSANEDPAYVDTKINTTRPMNAMESGLCLATPPDNRVFAYEAPGSYEHVVPINCQEMTVKIWGAGAAGAGDSGPVSGSSGAYINTVLSVNESNIIKINVGTGGSSRGASGGSTKISLTKNNLVLDWAQAGGGTYNSSGGIGTSSSGSYFISFDTVPGTTGYRGVRGWYNDDFRDSDNVNRGADTWLGDARGNGDSGYYCRSGGSGHKGDHRASYGGGGCTQKSWDTGAFDQNHHEDGWSLGGHGRVTVQCTKGVTF